MAYDFKTLSPADFEDLTRDLVGAEFKVRLEGFGPGPDGGVDGRHATDGSNLILQAKHKAGSTFASLKSVMKKERRAIDCLDLGRYILATSQLLTPLRKNQLAKIIGSALKNTGDILGCTELNAILGRNPAIEKAHIKLWLSSTAVLSRLLRSAAFAYTATSREEMFEKLCVFVPNPSFAKARQILEDRHVLIVSGPPGVGKTTLAQMLAYAYVGEEWEFTAVKSLDDGFAEIEDTKKQIFFFDDFLGKISLDRRALAARDTVLARFIRRVQRSKNARFILTTRAYIYEEARIVSESIGDPRLNISKYVLDVGVYTRRERARILYNHLVASSLSLDYVRALITDNALPKIVDHANYNPRIIEWMTDSTLLTDVGPESYVDRFINVLDHPIDIWDRAFREHIPSKAQHLLICLFFCSEYGEDLDKLHSAFNAVHARLCTHHNLTSSPTDFQDSLKLLEGSFISLCNRQASFVNPSVRDYLKQYLNDVNLLADLAPTAQSANWAQTVWQHYKSLETQGSIAPSKFVELFCPIGKRFKDLQAWHTSSSKPPVVTRHDLSLTGRVKLLAEWAATSGTAGFADSLRDLVFDSSDSFSPWLDGAELPELIAAFRSGKWVDFAGSGQIAEKLESHLIRILRSEPPSDDLNSIREAIEDADKDDVSQEVANALVDAINYEIEQTSWNVREFESETELKDHAERLKEMATWAGIDASSALRSVKSRLEKLREEKIETEVAAFPTGAARERDNFDDKSLKNLFEGLMRI